MAKKRRKTPRGLTPKPAQAATRSLESKWQEIGSLGLEHFMGYIQEAYTADLQWPAAFAIYNRIRRSDPEIAIVRTGYTSLARKTEIEVVPSDPDNAGQADEAAVEFFQSELENMDGTITTWLETLVAYTPFMGWSWWEVLPGLRKADWKPPEGDLWRSQYDDGLIGVRRLAWRDHSSFEKWEMDDATGRVSGLWQQDYPNPSVMLPLERSLHIVFGDASNPEGLTPLEAVYRLERIKHGLEVVQGMGYEHAAGYLNVKVAKGDLSPTDKVNIQAAARAILTAQEGNYAAWPKDIEGQVMDVPFTAGASILEAIRYYGLLKLQLYNMQWVAIASTAGTGAYSAMQEASSMFLTTWDAMIESFISQYDDQVGRRLWEWNKDKFKGAAGRPHYKAKPIQRTINLAELGAFLTAIRDTMPLGDDDLIEIRKRTGFLPAALPENATLPETEPEPGDDQGEDEAEDKVEDVEDGDMSQLARRPFRVDQDERATDVTWEAEVTETDIARAVHKFEKWAEENEPGLAALLRAQVEDDEDAG